MAFGIDLSGIPRLEKKLADLNSKIANDIAKECCTKNPVVKVFDETGVIYDKNNC